MTTRSPASRLRCVVLLSVVLFAAVYGGGAQGGRYDTFLFGVAYYPEHWDEREWDLDARRMRDAGVNVVRMGDFAWAVMEPVEGRYDFSLFDRAIAVMAKYGIRTVLATPTATPPKWLTHEHPDVLHVFESGRPADDQSRRHYCYNSETYRRFSRAIVDAMAKHYRDNPNVIGWQIDNEFNNENPECYSEACRVAFRRWLREKYGTLDALNERWGTRVWSQVYSDWEQIDLPFRTPAYHNPALMLDFKRFISSSVTSYMGEQMAILRRTQPAWFLTHNGVFRNIDYHRFTRGLDIYSQSNYPTFSAAPRYPIGASLTLVRGFTGRMMIIEQLTGPAGQTYLLRTPRPGEMRLWAMQSVAHGADGVIHFRWRSARRGAEEYWYGVLDHDNTPRRRYEEFKQEGLELARIGREVLGSVVDAEIAAIKDFEADWVFDHQFLTEEARPGAAYTALFQAASELRFNIDFVGPEADLQRYKIVFAPQLVMMDPALAGKFRAFVEAGGVLVMSAHSAIKDRDNAMIAAPPPGELADLFGVEVDSFQTYQPPSSGRNAARFSDGATAQIRVFAEALAPKTARPIAHWQQDYLAGVPAATERAVGRGKAVYYGSLFNVDSARVLMKRYVREQAVTPLIADAPSDVEVTRRRNADSEFLFVLNHAASAMTVQIGEGFTDVVSGAAAPSTLTLDAFGYRVLRRPRR